MERLVEPPVTMDMLERGRVRSPFAAQVAIDLLDALDGVDAPAALALESLAYGLLQGSGEHGAWLAARRIAAPLPAGRLIVTRRSDTLHLTLDRPQARTAIDVALRDALVEALAVAAADAEITEVRLDAIGPAFSIGGDLAEFGTTRDPAQAHAIRGATLPARALVTRRARFVVHVQGACIGAGLEIAAFADRLTASPDAWFQLPELAMGLIPGAGGCVSIPRRIGARRTLALLLSGRRISARVALDWGLIDAIVDEPPIDEGSAHRHG